MSNNMVLKVVSSVSGVKSGFRSMLKGIVLKEDIWTSRTHDYSWYSR